MQCSIERPEHQNGEGVPAFLYMELLINNKKQLVRMYIQVIK